MKLLIYGGCRGIRRGGPRRMPLQLQYRHTLAPPLLTKFDVARERQSPDWRPVNLPPRRGGWRSQVSTQKVRAICALRPFNDPGRFTPD
jgi:hypothetical protein